MIPKAHSCEVIVDTAFPSTVVLRRIRSSRRRNVTDERPRSAVLPSPTTFRHTRLIAAVRHEMHATKRMAGTSPLGSPVTAKGGAPFPTLSGLQWALTRVRTAIEALRRADLFHDDAPEGRHYLFLRPRDVEAALMEDRQGEARPLAAAARALSRIAPFSESAAPPMLLLVSFLDAAYWRTMRLEVPGKRAVGSPQEQAASVVNALYAMVRSSSALQTAWDSADAIEKMTHWASSLRAFHGHLDTYARMVRSGKGGPSAAALQRQVTQLTRAKHVVMSHQPRNTRSAEKKAALVDTIDAVADDVKRLAAAVQPSGAFQTRTSNAKPAHAAR